MCSFSVSGIRNLVVALMVATSAILPTVHGQEAKASKSLAARFPAENLIVYFEFDGLNAQPKAWQNTQLHNLLNKTTMGPLLRDLASQGLEQVFKAGENDAVKGEPDPKVLERLADNILHGGLAFGLYGQKANGDQIGVMIFRDYRKGFDSKVIEAYTPDSEKSETRAGRTIRIPSSQKDPASWFEGDDFIIADESMVDKAIATADGKGSNASSNAILTGMKSGSSKFVPLVRAFVDFSKIPSMPAQAKTLGLDGIRHIEMLGGFEEDKVRSIARIVAPSPRKRLLSLLDGPTFSAETMPPIHPSATGFSAASVEPGELFSKVSAIARSMDPNAGRQLDSFLNQFRAQTGVSLVDDLLAATGPGMSVGSMITRSGTPDFFATVQVKDGAEFSRTIDKLAPIITAMANQALQAQAGQNVGGFEITRAEGEKGQAEWKITLPGDAPGFAAISPRIRIEKNTLAFGLDPRTINMVQQLAAKRTPYAFKGDYAYIGQRLSKSMVFLSVQDVKTTLPATIAAIPTALQALDQAAKAQGNPPLPIRLKTELIPKPESLTPFLSPAMISVSVHPEGIKFDSISSAPSIDQPAVTAIAASLLLPAVQSAREAARRAQCANHHKQIALAMHSYADDNGGFPPMGIASATGEPLLSWRVELLPYLDEKALYDEIRKDEPWDSPHNKPLLDRMPAMFACPSGTQPTGMTCCRAFVGEGGILEKDKKTTLTDITDGTSNTILFAESSEPVEWTRPEGLSVNTPGTMGMGSRHPQGFYVALADGSVIFVSANTDPQVLKGLATKAGGEDVRRP
jgi:hypothetical protein